MTASLPDERLTDEERYVVKCEAYRDEAGVDPLPRLIGPFASREQATAHMDALGPLWGSWTVGPIAVPARVAARTPAPAVIDAAHLAHQREWSERTFGPGARLLGVLDHIRKELREIEDDPTDVTEWIDVVILALDGAWRAGWEPQQIIDAIKAKQARNEAREWPDWRSQSADRAIEHVRAGTPAPAPACTVSWPDSRSCLAHGVAVMSACEGCRAAAVGAPAPAPDRDIVLELAALGRRTQNDPGAFVPRGDDPYERRLDRWQARALDAAVDAWLAARPAPALAERDDLRARLRDLTSRLGYGDGVTEPMADNDTIVRGIEQVQADAREWHEHEQWRADCAEAGHPEDKDCAVHDPHHRAWLYDDLRELRDEPDDLREGVQVLRDEHRPSVIAERDDLRERVADVALDLARLPFEHEIVSASSQDTYGNETERIGCICGGWEYDANADPDEYEASHAEHVVPFVRALLAQPSEGTEGGA